MSKVKCNKCGKTIKIKSLFLEKAGCENCGNSIDFTTMDELSGLRQALMLGAAVVCGIVLFIVMIKMNIRFDQLPSLISDMSAQAAALLLMGGCVLVIVVGELEKIIGCSIYEKNRKREEELEKIAEQKRAEDAKAENK